MSTEPPPHLHPVPDTPDDYTLVPPHNTQYEKWVVGAALAHPGAAEQLRATGLLGSCFYTPALEQVWLATLTLAIQGKPTDPVTVTAELSRRKALTKSTRAALGNDPAAHLWQLAAEAPPTTDNALYYAQQLQALAANRRYLRLATRLTQMATNEAPDDDLRHLMEAELHAHLEDEARAGTGATGTADTWTPQDLTEILTGTHQGPQPALMALRNGQALLYPGKTHSVSGEPGSGKSFAAQLAVAQEITAGHTCIYFDFEDHAATLVDRLRKFGCTPEQIQAHLLYIRPDTALSPTTREALAALCENVTLAVVDGITEAMTMHGLSLMDNEDVARWLALLPTYIADQGPAVLQIDHVVKNAESRGRYAIGGQHKLAGISGAAYKMLTIKSMGRGQHGQAKLVLDKDRHGEIGPTGSTVAVFHLDATDTDQGLLYGWFDTPVEEHAEDGTWRPTGYMAKVSRFLQASPGTTTNAITSAVRGKRTHVMDALGVLITEGYVRTESGPRGASFHYLVSPFEEDSNDPS